jgi:hypothetical protein
MDWGYLYGTLVRNAGWTFYECSEQPAIDVFEFLDHLAAFPPDYVILAGYYGVPKRPETKRQAAMEQEGLKALSAVMGPAQPLPEHIRKMIDWAESFGKKLPN